MAVEKKCFLAHLLAARVPGLEQHHGANLAFSYLARMHMNIRLSCSSIVPPCQRARLISVNADATKKNEAQLFRAAIYIYEYYHSDIDNVEGDEISWYV